LDSIDTVRNADKPNEARPSSPLGTLSPPKMKRIEEKL
jgi:hypothetical protein